MSRNWIRVCKLKLDTPPQTQSSVGGGLGFDLGGGSAGNVLDLSEMRIKFTCFRHTVLTPNESWIRVYNLKRETVLRIIDATKKRMILTLEAGYKDASGPIYKGKMIYSVIGRESPTDTFIDINCQDAGDMVAGGTVNKTFDPGSTQKDHMKYLLGIAKDQFGIEEGKTDNLLTDKYPKSFTMHGMLGDAWRTLARSNDNQTFVDMGKMYTVPLSYTRGEVRLSEATGLIGIPQVTSAGIIITALMNPAFQPKVKLILDSKMIRQLQLPRGYEGLIDVETTNSFLGVGDGEYIVESIEYRGDTRGTEWYAIMSAHGPSGGGGDNSFIATQ